MQSEKDIPPREPKAVRKRRENGGWQIIDEIDFLKDQIDLKQGSTACPIMETNVDFSVFLQKACAFTDSLVSLLKQPPSETDKEFQCIAELQYKVFQLYFCKNKQDINSSYMKWLIHLVNVLNQCLQTLFTRKWISLDVTYMENIIQSLLIWITCEQCTTSKEVSAAVLQTLVYYIYSEHWGDMPESIQYQAFEALETNLKHAPFELHSLIKDALVFLSESVLSTPVSEDGTGVVVDQTKKDDTDFADEENKIQCEGSGDVTYGEPKVSQLSDFISLSSKIGDVFKIKSAFDPDICSQFLSYAGAAFDIILASDVEEEILLYGKAMFETLLNIVSSSESLIGKPLCQQWFCKITTYCWHCIRVIQLKKSFQICSSHLLQLLEELLKTTSKLKITEHLDKVNKDCLVFCVSILDDIIFDEDVTDMVLHAKEKIIPLLNEIQIIPDSKIMETLNVILAYLSLDDNRESLDRITVGDSYTINVLKPPLRSMEESRSMLVALKKIKYLSQLAKNRSTFRKNGFLEDLEGIITCDLIGMKAQELAADLVPVLLSDSQESPEQSHEDIVDSSTTSVSPLLEVGVLATPVDGSQEHGKILHKLFTLHQERFRYLIEEGPNLLSRAFLAESTELLTSLGIYYEQSDDHNIQELSHFGKDLLCLKQSIKALSVVVFACLMDFYNGTDEQLDNPNSEMFKKLGKYLDLLHFCILFWTKKELSCQAALVENGLIYLILNELHTAPTAPIINNNVQYAIVCSLFNISLNAALVPKFHFIVSKKFLHTVVLQHRDPEIALVAKLTLANLRILLRRSDMNAICLSDGEAANLMNCMTGNDTFFGGRQALMTVVKNLCFLESNGTKLDIFSIVSKSLPSKEEADILQVILNMIPEVPPNTDEDCKPDRAGTASDNIISSQIHSVNSQLESFIQKHANKGDLKGKAIQLLMSPVSSPSINDAKMLYSLERFGDCGHICKIVSIHCQGVSVAQQNELLLLKAKCLFRWYIRDLPSMLTKINEIPSFQFKELMSEFCKQNVLQVLKILTKLVHVKENQNHLGRTDDSLETSQRKPHSLQSKETEGHWSSLTTKPAQLDEESFAMLDEAILHNLLFNSKMSKTCLLCHAKTDKLKLSHIIPKSILAEFARQKGADAFQFTPTKVQDMQFKSAGQVSIAMLCGSCENQILSPDENSFKERVYKIIYRSDNPYSYLLPCTVQYNAYLFRFAAGLFFRASALLANDLIRDTGNLATLLWVLKRCRCILLAPRDKIIFEEDSSFNFYLFLLPTVPPSYIKEQHTWKEFTVSSVTGYCSYDILKPGVRNIPLKADLILIKLGVMLFALPLGDALKDKLHTSYGKYRIRSVAESLNLVYPKDLERVSSMPLELWWNLQGFASSQVRYAFSRSYPVSHPNKATDDKIISGSAGEQKLIANLLPAGFSLNIEKYYEMLPDKVVILPPNHIVLLHHCFTVSNGGKAYIFVAMKDVVVSTNTSQDDVQGTTSPHASGAQKAVLAKAIQDHSLYAKMSMPYILLFYEHQGIVVKCGLTVSDASKVEHLLPGSGTSMNKLDSQLKEIVSLVPRFVQLALKAKGIRSLKSLVFGYSFFRTSKEGPKCDSISSEKELSSLDTKCLGDEKCGYCFERCSYCMQSCFHCYYSKKLDKLGSVRYCSESCFSANHKDKPIVQQNYEELLSSPNGHTKLLQLVTNKNIKLAGHSFNEVIHVSFHKAADPGHTKFGFPSDIIYYAKVWIRSVAKQQAVEYTFDDKFENLKMIDFKNAESVYSEIEEEDMLQEVHDVVVNMGGVYHFMSQTLDV